MLQTHLHANLSFLSLLFKLVFKIAPKGMHPGHIAPHCVSPHPLSSPYHLTHHSPRANTAFVVANIMKSIVPPPPPMTYKMFAPQPITRLRGIINCLSHTLKMKKMSKCAGYKHLHSPTRQYRDVGAQLVETQVKPMPFII